MFHAIRLLPLFSSARHGGAIGMNAERRELVAVNALVRPATERRRAAVVAVLEAPLQRGELLVMQLKYHCKGEIDSINTLNITAKS
jgi:hypothetical protein